MRRVTFLTLVNERQTETVKSWKPGLPSARRSLGNSDHRRWVGESIEMFFAANKLQRGRGKRVTDCISRFEEGVKTLQDNEIDLLPTEDV